VVDKLILNFDFNLSPLSQDSHSGVLDLKTIIKSIGSVAGSNYKISFEETFQNFNVISEQSEITFESTTPGLPVQFYWNGTSTLSINLKLTLPKEGKVFETTSTGKSLKVLSDF
jgi:hypothetical protein